MPRARLLRHRARLVATQPFSWRQYPKCTANTSSAAIRIPCARSWRTGRRLSPGGAPTRVGGTPFMSAVLIAQSTLSLLELRYVNLAPGEALLENVERRV